VVKSLFSDDARTGRTFFLLALLLGAALRFYAPLASDFPLMDGGMFLVAAREVGTHGFALPLTLPYPTVVPNIPFCYPPLAFYLVALLQVLGVSLETSLRFVPAFFATACIWAMWRLGLAVFAGWEKRDSIAGLSTLTFALLPWASLSLLAGGGLTRAPGDFLALWGIERAILFWRDGDKRAFWSTTVLLALCLATHLERARFFAVALFLVWLGYNRSWRGFARVFVCIGAALLLVSPWWGLCLARFGAAPFLASYASGSRDWVGAPRWVTALGGEYQPLLVWFSLLGMLIYWRRLPFLWLWFGAIVVTEVRSGRNFISAPESLAAAAMFFRIGAPQGGEAGPAPTRARMLTRAAVAALFATWLSYQGIYAATHCVILPRSERAAMRWCRDNTPANSRFLVVPTYVGRHWAEELGGEWFPALTARASPLTVQASEWLPNRGFARQQRRYNVMAWARSWAEFQRAVNVEPGVSYNYVFVPHTRPEIEKGLRTDPQWELVFANQGAHIYVRQKEDNRAAP